MNKFIKKLYKIIILIIKLLLFIDILENYLIKNYYFVLIGLVALILTFLPEILAKILKTKLNELMSFSIVFFMFISLYLGTLKNFYRFIWWDTMLHLISRLILGLLAIVLMENLNMENFSSHLLNPKFIFLYILSFVALCGVIWEIYEFTVDTLFGLDMQGASFTGVVDTMEDLIADLVGGIIPAIYGYITFKNK
ncbi:hypothetical protein BD780_001381 [Clostridium tetanomorphum]|uniref:hypothetical protein n=1 Tax=Clostridium tetanomorphum TaxID=1553 RepID=UPI0004474857|nr:hypothetical protein [Clostridium tetanomorphum]KAJ51060.1 membrane-spanning protein [Clostridium tetanomorphum DSM 665]MBP1864686.1 hypothetical protein [Clostridium tetanomorphum]NRS84156.1 hypothetical protein [Clostridium tetanomorphum]SQB92641.1 membrane-spanning protein [Clostridium tetanomorphum]